MQPALGFALFFLIPGVWLCAKAAAGIARFEKSLTAVGMAIYSSIGAVLAAVGVACLMGLDRPWFYWSGHAAFGIWMVTEGTGRLYVKPSYSVAMQWIFMVAGLGLLAFLASSIASMYIYYYY